MFNYLLKNVYSYNEQKQATENTQAKAAENADLKSVGTFAEATVYAKSHNNYDDKIDLESEAIDAESMIEEGIFAIKDTTLFCAQILEETRAPDFSNRQIQDIINSGCVIQKVSYKDYKEAYKVGYCINNYYTLLGIFVSV